MLFLLIREYDFNGLFLFNINIFYKMCINFSLFFLFYIFGFVKKV